MSEKLYQLSQDEYRKLSELSRRVDEAEEDFLGLIVDEATQANLDLSSKPGLGKPEPKKTDSSPAV